MDAGQDDEDPFGTDPVEDFAWLLARAKEKGFQLTEEQLRRTTGLGKEDFERAVRLLREVIADEGVVVVE